MGWSGSFGDAPIATKEQHVACSAPFAKMVGEEVFHICTRARFPSMGPPLELLCGAQPVVVRGFELAWGQLPVKQVCGECISLVEEGAL